MPHHAITEVSNNKSKHSSLAAHLIPCHLDEVLDGGVGLLGDILERVVSLNQAASDYTK